MTVATSHTSVSPDNTVFGDCGSSFLYISNYGAGDAYIRYGFNSALGPVVFRNLEVNWTNFSTGKTGSRSNVAFMYSSSYSTVYIPYTGAGFVYAVLSGTVMTASGTCVIGEPNSSTTIT